MKGGQVMLRKGYGMANLELGVPIQPDMVFELGSITKQFTATAVLMLQERGKLSIEDDVTKYLPDYPTQGQKITIDHLLTHVSGIPSYTGLPEWLPRVREDLTVQQLIDIFKDKPLEFNPGEKWSYNNSAYILLGAVIEKVSGKSYEDFIEQEIFAPLGMKRSYYGHQNEVIPGRVSGYDKLRPRSMSTWGSTGSTRSSPGASSAKGTSSSPAATAERSRRSWPPPATTSTIRNRTTGSTSSGTPRERSPAWI